MKIILAFALCFTSTFCFAQNDSINLKELELPNSPGFILLDQAPASIERPNTPRAFTLSLFNSFSQSNGIPNNYAVEFTPFWFLKHPNMNALKYAGYKDRKPHPFSSIKMISLSMAYVNKTDSISNKPINNIAFGARTTVLKLYSKKHKEDIIAANFMAVKRLKGFDYLLNQAGATPQLLIEDPAKYHELESECLKILADSNSTSPLAEVLKEKPRFAIEAATAYSMFFTNNNFSTNRFGRFGAWLTLNYSQNLNKEATNYINFYMVSRFLSDGTTLDSLNRYTVRNSFDIGGKLEVEFKKLSIAFEYIYRANEVANTFRSSGLLKYKIAENIYLTGALGKNFGNNDNLVSILGINWGLGTTGNEHAKVD